VAVTGTVSEKAGGALPGATVKVLKADSSFLTGAVSDPDGVFTLSLPAKGRFILLFSFLSYRDQYKTVDLNNAPLSLGKITMRESSKTLSEVEVQTTQQRGQQKGDTTQFNADAFKTHPDATAEDLIKKMPGVTSDGNGVKVNGESVQKILVDGKPFFGDDPNAAIKNLPAEIIDKVEVFDKMSDQASFTGFADGDQQKTINFVTKKNRNTGQFGKIYGGYGIDEMTNSRYNAGASINSFNNKRRVTLLLLSNNINQQNFSSSDITGAMGSSGSSGRGGGGPGGGGASSSLLTAPQNGNTTTQSAGLNYSDSWGKKINISGSYFFNYSDNKNLSSTNRRYFTADNQTYQSSTNSETTNSNHRINLRFEYNIDSANKLTIVPSLSSQNNRSTTSLVGDNIKSIADIIQNRSHTDTRSTNDNLGYDFNNNLLFQHKFAKKGRTISLNVTTLLSERQNNGTYNSMNSYYDINDTTTPGGADTTRLNQVFNLYSYNKRVSGSLSYTEPLNKSSQLQLNYTPSYNVGKSDKKTNDVNPNTGEFIDFNSALSNKYENTYSTQKGGLSYRYQKDKMNINLGADAQTSMLNGQQTYPIPFPVNRSFKNILPNAMLNYKFSKSRNLRVYYRSNTNIPSISQLQNVINISNPLQISAGNEYLKQTFENNVNIRFGGFNQATSRNSMLFINASFIDNYISNATYILRSDSVIQGYNIKAGSQLTKPVNLDNYYTARIFYVYGFPVKQIKSNLNVNAGVNYGHTPSIINNLLNMSNSYALSSGIFIGSNVSDKLDFSLAYNANYTIVKNSVQRQSDNSYFNHAASFKINWIFYKGFVLNTDVTQTLYNGLTQNYSQSYFLWNAYIGYKFFKNNALEAKLSVFDILNQNRSIGRNITGSYTEDYKTTVLRRYGMLTLTYTLRNFKGAQPPPEQKENQHNLFPNGPPPGMRQGRPDGGGSGGNYGGSNGGGGRD